MLSAAGLALIIVTLAIGPRVPNTRPVELIAGSAIVCGLVMIFAGLN
jgi:hypothetical protein